MTPVNRKKWYSLYVRVPGGTVKRHNFPSTVPAPDEGYLAGHIITEARETLVALLGPTVEVVRITSNEYTVFDSAVQGYRPIPVVLPPRMAETERPYDTFLDLCGDEHDGMGTGEYLAWLLER